MLLGFEGAQISIYFETISKMVEVKPAPMEKEEEGCVEKMASYGKSILDGNQL